MNERDSIDDALRAAVRGYAGRADDPARTASDVATAAIAPLPKSRRASLWLLPIAAVIGVLALAAVALSPMSPLAPDDSTGSEPLTATVDGIRYDVSFAGSLVIESEDLTPAGKATGRGVEDFFRDPQAYRLPDVDPRAALVAVAKPDMTVGGQPVGEYLLLFGPESPYPALCSYFRADDPGSPRECKSRQSLALGAIRTAVTNARYAFDRA